VDLGLIYFAFFVTLPFSQIANLNTDTDTGLKVRFPFLFSSALFCLLSYFSEDYLGFWLQYIKIFQVFSLGFPHKRNVFLRCPPLPFKCLPPRSDLVLELQRGRFAVNTLSPVPPFPASPPLCSLRLESFSSPLPAAITIYHQNLGFSSTSRLLNSGVVPLVVIPLSVS